MNTRIIAGSLLTFLLLAAGCATTKEKVILAFPPPPDEPRIAYVDSYQGERDFAKRSFLDAILGTPRQNDLIKPYGVVSYGDRIYVTDTGAGQVEVFNLAERTVGTVGDDSSARLASPLGIAAAADGTVFVSDIKLKKIFGYDQTGKARVAIGKKGEFENPSGLAVNDELKRLYVVDSYAHEIKVYSLSGESLFKFGKRGGGDGEFNYPSNVAVDRRNGNICVVDTQNFRVQVFDKDGKFLRKFGEVGDSPGNFSRPKGIGLDSDGHIYVADAAFDNVQIFDDESRLLLTIGSAGSNPGYFSLPAGLYVDGKDRIYVVDSSNERVQVFQYMSDAWKKEHPEEYKQYELKETNP